MWAMLSGEVAVSAAPRCGSQSLGAFMRRRPPVTTPPAQCRRRVMFIREPFERLVSAYSHFAAGPPDRRRYRRLPEGALDSWEAFVDATFEVDDIHWRPQTDLIRGYTEVMLWDRLPAFVHEVTGDYLPWINAAEKLEVDLSYRADELSSRYCEDIEAHLRAGG